MSFRTKLLSAGILISTLATPALADSNNSNDGKGFYGVLSVGLSDVTGTDWETDISGTKYGGDAPVDAGFLGEIGVGYDFGKWRTDLTFENGGGDLGECTEDKNAGTTCTNSGDLVTNTFMLNGYYDFPTDSKWSPYLGAGIGQTTLETDQLTIGGTKYELDKDDVFLYQLKAGVAYPVSVKTDLFAEAAYKVYDDYSTGVKNSSVNFKLKNTTEWAAKIGVRYMF